MSEGYHSTRQGWTPRQLTAVQNAIREDNKAHGDRAVTLDRAKEGTWVLNGPQERVESVLTRANVRRR